jgi:hypothetical protein
VLLFLCLASLPNELGPPPRASLLWQARRIAHWQEKPPDPLVFGVSLAKERKGVVADYRFAGELKSLPVGL